MTPMQRTQARNDRWSALDARNDAVKRLIRAGDTEANIRKRYAMSDTSFNRLRMQARA